MPGWPDSAAIWVLRSADCGTCTLNPPGALNATPPTKEGSAIAVSVTLPRSVRRCQTPSPGSRVTPLHGMRSLAAYTLACSGNGSLIFRDLTVTQAESAPPSHRPRSAAHPAGPRRCSVAMFSS